MTSRKRMNLQVTRESGKHCSVSKDGHPKSREPGDVCTNCRCFIIRSGVPRKFKNIGRENRNIFEMYSRMLMYTCV